MTSAAEEIRRAVRDDVADMLVLQEQNVVERGGLLSVAFPRPFFEMAVAEMPVMVAHRQGRLIAYLISSQLAVHAHVPIIGAMQGVYRGAADAYLYGPICVAQNERGRGVAGRLFTQLRKLLPGREGILFIRQDNMASLSAHRKMGIREVATFTHDGVGHSVLSYIG